MKIFPLFLSKGLAFILFVLFFFLLKVGDQSGATQIAALLFCMATLYSTIMQFVTNPKEIYRIWLLKQIIYLGFFGLAAYYDSLVYIAFGFIVYNGIITVLASIQKLRGINFIEEALPKVGSGLLDLLASQDKSIQENNQQVLKTINNIYIRNSLIMTLLYIIVLPFSRYAGYEGLYVFLTFMVLPLVSWRLNLQMISNLYKTFVDIKASTWEDAFTKKFTNDDGVTLVNLNLEADEDGTIDIKFDKVLVDRLEASKAKLQQTLDQAQEKCKHYKHELDLAKETNNEQAIALAQELYDQAKSSTSKLQKRIDDLDIKIAKVKDGVKLSEKELEETIETGLKNFFADLYKNNPRFKEMFGDDFDAEFNEDKDQNKKAENSNKAHQSSNYSEPTDTEPTESKEHSDSNSDQTKK